MKTRGRQIRRVIRRLQPGSPSSSVWSNLVLPCPHFPVFNFLSLPALFQTYSNYSNLNFCFPGFIPFPRSFQQPSVRPHIAGLHFGIRRHLAIGNLFGDWSSEFFLPCPLFQTGYSEKRAMAWVPSANGGKGRR